MRKLLVVGLGLALAACGGSQKAQTGGSTKGIGASGEVSEAGDLKIPKVDATLCDTSGKDVAKFDLNRDGKPDVWKLYKTKSEKGTNVQIMTCKQVDLDHEGRKDYVAQFDDTGAIIVEEYDFDFDGKFDSRVHYDQKTNKRYLVERSTQFGSGPDTWEKYDASERVESIRRDRNGDKKPDYWEQYRDGTLETILFDDDYDGKVDRQESAKVAAAPAPAAEPEATPADGEGKPEDKPADEGKPADGKPAAGKGAPKKGGGPR